MLTRRQPLCSLWLWMISYERCLCFIFKFLIQNFLSVSKYYVQMYNVFDLTERTVCAYWTNTIQWRYDNIKTYIGSVFRLWYIYIYRCLLNFWQVKLHRHLILGFSSKIWSVGCIALKFTMPYFWKKKSILCMPSRFNKH